MKPLGYFYNAPLTDDLLLLEHMSPKFTTSTWQLLIELAANRLYASSVTSDNFALANQARNTVFKRLPQALVELLSDVEDDTNVRWGEIIAWAAQQQ